jgi:oxygen-dependent protoporphyrinogen oxidase
MGESFLNYAVDPFVSGIYAGDPDKLITRYALPKLYALEQNYGSFILGAVKKKKLPKTELEQRVTRAVFSVRGGLAKLIQALVAAIGSENILYDVSDLKARRTERGFSSVFCNAQEDFQINSGRVISTIGSHHIPEVFSFISGEESLHFKSLRYAAVVQVVAGFKQWSGLQIKSFGGLVPSSEKKDILGVLFPSALFTNRAPKGGALLSFFIGGIKHPELFSKSDDEITDIVCKSLKKMMLCDEVPDLLRIFRYPKAIPQYEKGTGERLNMIQQIEQKYPGLIIAGNIKDGIGMADRVKQSAMIVEKIIAEKINIV